MNNEEGLTNNTFRKDKDARLMNDQTEENLGGGQKYDGS